MHDLLIRGGRVIDSARGIDEVLDVVIDGHRVTAVESLPLGEPVRQVVDAAGLIVTPGLIDLHTHVYWGVPPLGIEPDPHNLKRGVTTAVDAGSAGASTFPAFRRYIIDVSATRIVALLHIAQQGMAQDSGQPDEVAPELGDVRWARVDRAIDVCRAHADVIVGLKVRLSLGCVGPDPEDTREILRRMRKVSDAIGGKPSMIHFGGTTITIDELLCFMATGDILTHAYHGRTEGVLDAEGRVRRSVRHAVDRGVGFDVGHGSGSFNWDVAKRALDQGLQPSTISSDIHAWSVGGPAYDLATTASKFLHLGLSLPEVIQKLTSRPAEAIGMAGQIGTLAPGAEADVSILRLENGEWPYTDAHHKTLIGNQRLVPVKVVRAGQVHDCTPAVYQPVPAHAH